MAHRLLPFRQYDENDVINLFALTTSTNLLTTKPAADGDHCDGVFVGVSNGNAGDSVIDLDDGNDVFFQNYSSPLGRNPYPTNPMKVAAAGSGSAVMGVTLKSTLSIDENNEQLLFNPVKKDELQAVLSGQTVPVLTKGVVTLTAKAVEGAEHAQGPGAGTVPGNLLVAGVTAGKVSGISPLSTSTIQEPVIGQILATGYRESLTATASAAGTDVAPGWYFICKIDC